MVTKRKHSSRIKVRKYMGDDIYSWAVFLDGAPAYTGLSKGQSNFYRDLVQDSIDGIAEGERAEKEQNNAGK